MTELPPGFMSIETAPQDGTMIEVYDPKPGPEYGPDVHEAYWDATLGWWVAAPGVDTDPFDIDPSGWRPTRAAQPSLNPAS